MSESHFLLTKVTVPPVRSTLVPRSSLTRRLDEGSPLVLLAAGAGFGKTTLLSAWARGTRGLVAWLTLDEQDNDPTRFWGYVLLALSQSGTWADHAPGEAARALLTSTPVSPLPTVLTSLLNELAILSEDVVLILDDYHLIEEPLIHQSLDFVLAHAPACLHLVLSSRIDPALSLSRLRARGQLVEIREADLRLSASDAALFLRQTMGLQVEEEAVRDLWQRTEGWLVGLQLAALSLRTHADPAAFVKHFSGSHRFLMDYVQQEILERQSLGVQRFLLHTSILTFLQADLCQQLWGEPSIQASQRMLEALARANLFLVPLDEERRWYRYHPLFREVLQAHLQASEPEQVPLLHRLASAWYAEQHRLHEAIPHALAAHDEALAADLIERFVVPQSWRNEYHTLRSWLGQLPKVLLRTRPGLSFLAAQVIILTTLNGPSAWQLAQEPLNLAEQGYCEAGNQAGVGSVLTVRAVLAGYQGDFLRAFAASRQALTLLPPEDRQWRGLCLCVLGMEAVLSGQHAEAVSLLTQALALCDAAGSLPGTQFATVMRGEVCLATGDLQQAAYFFRQVLFVSTGQPDLTLNQLTDEMGARRSHFERLAWYNLAYLAFERNDLAEAQHALREGLAEGWFVLLHMLTPGLLQVRFLYARGEIEQARTLLVELAAGASHPHVKLEVQLCQAWLALAQGELGVAKQWEEGLSEANEPLVRARRVEQALLRVRLRIASGQPEAALRELAPRLEEARGQTHRHSELQLLVQQALAQAASGALVQAMQTLLETVTAAHSQGLQRLFLEEGQPMERLLKRLLPDVREQAIATFVRTLLHAFAATPSNQDARSSMHPPVDVTALTSQERRVLVLLAEGASNQQIANHLVISLATARKHVSNILGKLGVHSRTQALARAREDGLL